MAKFLDLEENELAERRQKKKNFYGVSSENPSPCGRG